MTVKRRIKFGQINLHKCKAAAAELNQRGYYDINLITELYSTRGRVRLEVKNGAVIAANKGKVNSAKGMYKIIPAILEDG